jgi:hypothetical protein
MKHYGARSAYPFKDVSFCLESILRKFHGQSIQELRILLADSQENGLIPTFHGTTRTARLVGFTDLSFSCEEILDNLQYSRLSPINLTRNNPDRNDLRGLAVQPKSPCNQRVPWPSKKQSRRPYKCQLFHWAESTTGKVLPLNSHPFHTLPKKRNPLIGPTFHIA